MYGRDTSENAKSSGCSVRWITGAFDIDWFDSF